MRATGIRVVKRPERERGFIAVTTALLLVVMLMATAMALDVAIWYTRGLELQRSADAAALAAVARMPNFAQAEDAAKQIAVRNGLDPDAMVVERDPESPRRIKISVKQDVQSFFGNLIRPSTVVGRKATAEFVSSIDMGSRLNGIGTADLITYPVVGQQNFWLAINGYCTAKEDGDRFASAFDGNRAGGVTTCTEVPAVVPKNLDYRQPGVDAPQYTYLVNVPCPVPGEDPCVTDPTRDTIVSVYNPTYDNSNQPGTIDSNTIDPADANFYNSQVDTTFGIRDQEARPIPALPPRTFYTCNYCPGSNGWQPLFQIPKSLGAGVFKVDVNTANGQANSYGSNAFSLLAHWADEGIGPCTDCASMSGESSISVYANAAGNTVDFYLARLAPALDFRGKRIQILLWDVGEGADSISILQPTAAGYSPMPFKFRTFDHGLDGVPVDDKFPLTNVPSGVLDVSGTASALGAQAPPWPLTERANDYKFNGRMLSLELTVPTDYGCVPLSRPCVPAPIPQDGWWKIRYTTSAGSVFDRSTWTVRLLGDPVHLVAD
jgi:Putative Flp pilus-assembly TadE/G-like